MVVSDAHVFPGFLTPVLTQFFFQKPPTTFLTCFSRGERRKCAGKEVHLNRGSNSQPPDHEFDTLTTEPPGRGKSLWRQADNSKITCAQSFEGGHKKEDLLITVIFYFSKTVFCPFRDKFYHRIDYLFVVCNKFQLG